MDDDEVAMRAVTRRGSSADVARTTTIVPERDGFGWQLVAGGIADASGQLCHVGGDVENGPMPKAARRWCIGVVDRDDEALRLLREARPRELRGDVLTPSPEDARDLRAAERLPL